MSQKYKKLLIVDDSEIDRTILRAILSEEFDVWEADNGYSAIEMMMHNKDQLDGILLDISMPVVDGFDVLHRMEDNGLSHIPVFLITSETTKENVITAAQHGIREFIRKPFDSAEVIRRIKSKLGVITQRDLTPVEYVETEKYISKLEAIYKTYLSNFGKDDKHYVNMVALMKILLTRYSIVKSSSNLTKEKIEIISKAAYFCDIGNIFVPDKFAFVSKENLKAKHPSDLGSKLIRLNSDPNCASFVEICSDMCLYHNERYDGKGTPNKISGKNISIYNQMCRLCDELDSLYSKLFGSNNSQVSFIIKKLSKDEGMVSPEVMSLLEDCTESILSYYSKL